MGSEVEGPVLVESAIATGEKMEGKETCTDFKSASIDMSIENWTESVNVNVGFEKERDTVDFSGGVDSKWIEVGCETFGERTRASIDSLTQHEPRSQLEDASSEFICDMVDCEGYSETRFVDHVSSAEEVKVCDISMEVKSTTIESTHECIGKVIETGIEVYRSTCDIGTETIVFAIVEGSSCYELCCLSIDCESREVVEDIVVDTEEQVKTGVISTEDESVCITVLMTDIGTVVEFEVEDRSEETEVRCVEMCSEGMKENETEDLAIETERSEIEHISLTSAVEYSSIDVQFEESKPTMRESGYEMTLVTMDCYNTFQVLFLYMTMLALTCIK
jgi:hypothetical protein